jgi:hypothetical protein
MRMLPAAISIGSNNELGVSAGGEGSTLTISVADGVYTLTDTENFALLFNAGTATFSGIGTRTLTISGISEMQVTTAAGGDTVNLLSTDVPIEIDLGFDDNDVANIGSDAPGSGGVLSGIRALVTVKDPDTATLNVDDSGDPTGRTVFIGELPSRAALLFSDGPIIEVEFDNGATNIYGGMGDDTFTGASLLGPQVNLFGGGGDDTLDYEPLFITAVQSFDGGDGTNTINYELIPVSGTALHIDLQAGTATFPPSIANIQHVIGTPGDDTIIGSGGPDILEGSFGNDSIQGGGGADVLNGGDGNDTLIGGTGDDTMNGGAGDDLLVWNNGDNSDVMDGGTGNNVVQVNGSNGATGDRFTFQVNPLDAASFRFDRTNLVPFNLIISNADQLQVNGQDGDDTLTLDFANGYPMPAGIGDGPGVLFDGGGGADNRLALARSSGTFTADLEAYDPSGPGAGLFFFLALGAGLGARFLNVASLDDTAPTSSFLFNPPVGPQTVRITDGPLVDGSTTMQIASGDAPPGFDPVNVANKASLSIQAASGTRAIVLDHPVAADGLASLLIMGNSSLEQVTVAATPAGVATEINALGASTVVDVRGAGVAAGTTLTVESGSTLNYGAGGAAADVTPGPLPTQVTIAQPGSGAVVVEDFDQIHVLNRTSPPTVFVTPPPAIDAVEDQALIDVVVTQFNADPLGEAAQYAVTIDWGDGSPPVAGSVAQGASNAAVYSAAGSHAYNASGTYITTVTVRDRGGPATTYVGGVPVTTHRIPVAPVTATAARVAVAGAALRAQGATVGAVEDQDTGPVLVASFQDTGGALPLDSYAATIDWGDGTATTEGTLTALGTSPAGTTFVVRGRHTYGAPGTFPIAVTITSADGAAALAHGSAFVAGPPATVGTLTGRLDPRSDTGVSQEDGITRDNTPRFLGTAGPGAIVTLRATPTGGGASTPLGRAVTDAAGNWTIDAPLIPDGSYDVAASAVGEDGSTTSETLQTVVMDTVGPQVTGTQLDRADGRVVLGFRDDRSGLDGRGPVDGANYAFTRANSRPGRFLVTSLAETPPSGLTSVVVAAVNDGRWLRGGIYTLVVRSGGVQDVAGNALDGKFFGSFPSGDGEPGGDFVARLDSIRRIIYSASPLDSTASPLVPPGTRGRSVLIPTGGAVGKNRLRLARAWEAWFQRQADARARRHAARDAAMVGSDVRPGT